MVDWNVCDGRSCYGEIIIAVALILWALAGIIFWRLRLYLEFDERGELQSRRDLPWRVFVWFMLAGGLLMTGVFLFNYGLSLRHQSL
jgi:hypothetical protein